MIFKKNTYILFLSFMCLLSCNNGTKQSGSNQKQAPDSPKKLKSITSEPLFSSLSYSKIKERKGVVLKNDSIKNLLNKRFKNTSSIDIDSLINFTLDLTKEQLSFSFGKCRSNPNQLVHSQKANCIGYAAYFNSVINYVLNMKGLTKKYSCKHFVGKIYLYGQNVNALFNDPFFKDHDYNIVKNLETGKAIAVDASLYEYMGVKRISIKN